MPGLGLEVGDDAMGAAWAAGVVDAVAVRAAVVGPLPARELRPLPRPRRTDQARTRPQTRQTEVPRPPDEISDAISDEMRRQSRPCSSMTRPAMTRSVK